MDKYEYLPIENVVAGNIVECLRPSGQRYTMGKLYIVKALHCNLIEVTLCDDGYTEDQWDRLNFKLVKTKPGDEAIVGDEVICVNSYMENHEVHKLKCKAGDIYTVEKREEEYVNDYYAKDYVTLCKPTSSNDSTITTGSIKTKFLRDKAYYKYWQKIYDAGIPILHQRKDTWDVKNTTPMEEWRSCLISPSIEPCEFQLKDHLEDEPTPGTQEYLDFWDDKFDSGDKVYLLAVDGTYPTSTNPSVWAGFEVFSNSDLFKKQEKSIYPLYARWKKSNEIVKFISPAEGTTVDTGRSSNKIGYKGTTWTEHSDDRWEILPNYIEESTSKPRVAIVTVNVGGFPIGTKIIQHGPKENHMWVKETNISGDQYRHDLGLNCEWEDTILTNPCVELLADTNIYGAASEPEFSKIEPYIGKMLIDGIMASATADQHEGVTTPNPIIGNIMNKDITIKIPASAVVQAAKEAKVKTDLQNSKKVLAVTFRGNGDKYDVANFKSVAAAEKSLQQPSRLGMTIKVYELVSTKTTDIPLIDA